MNKAFNNYAQAAESLYTYLHGHLGMNREQLIMISDRITVRKFDRKCSVITPGEVDHYFNFIITGAARKYVLGGKKEFTIQLATEGHFIHDELSFFTQKPSECYIETIEATEFFSIRYDDLERLYTEMPELNRFARLMLGEMFLKKEIRDTSYMRFTPRERFLQYVEQHPDVLQRVSQKYIASFLHIKPETFSRLKHLLKEKGNP
ncbi:Crp/Fnr family transcriptional regulator [Flavihumibacter fluvii]|uniref:Crp/Fnr family transcriptional regulator n=1 Tax=Flavihumibacter fluvii TaxID=2838157 RepID=UPI001BDE0C64|nr:Crp/Fnr family transcriptional regulator [Flavihumibacter fluvii]ULQ53684.1 Crp/Fnr family transcriptional regulator [Flavihumibacter fluvii]